MRGLIRIIVAASAVAIAQLAPVAGQAAAAPASAWSPTTSSGIYDYGAVDVDQTASQTFRLTNSRGSATGILRVSVSGSSAFSITADACEGTALGKRESCTVTVQYVPSTPGQSDTATLTASGVRPVARASITLTGSGAAEQPVGTLTCAPDPFAYGPLQVGGLSDVQVFTCTAGGDGTVPISQATSTDPGQFAITSDQCDGVTLEPGQTCTIQVQYDPSVPATPSAPHQATLNVPYDGSGAPETVTMTGTAFANATLDCTPNGTMNFATFGGGSDGPDPQTCTNNGPQSITVGTPTITGSDADRFVIASNSCGTLASGASCVIGVTYNGPNVSATHAATLSIPHNGKASDGTAFAPEGAFLSGTSTFLG